MASQKKNNRKKHKEYINLAFELAKINLGSTNTNPSVGCIVEKNGSVLSSGYTSISGRPHAEFNALNNKINLRGANIYTTLEPCSHYGKTPPCINIIKKKGIDKVLYSIDDFDLRSKNKSKKKLQLKKIKVFRNLLKKQGKIFYASYYNFINNKIPLIEGKIAISKDNFTKNKTSKWITNNHSRKLAHLLRSNYNAILSTSKSINEDNSLLDCRIDGLEKKSPDLIIIDRFLKIKKNLNLFKEKKSRKIILITTKSTKKKIKWLKYKKVKIIQLKKMDKINDYKTLFNLLLNKGYSRILIETGLTFLNFLIKNNFLTYIYVFKSEKKIKKNGINYGKINLIKNIKLKNKLQTNLFEDKVYKEKIN